MLLSGPPPDSLRVYPVSVGGPVCGGTNIVLLSGPPPDSLRVYPVSVGGGTRLWRYQYRVARWSAS